MPQFINEAKRMQQLAGVINETETATATDVKDRFRELGTKIPQRVSSGEATAFLELLDNILEKMSLGEITMALKAANQVFTTKTQSIKPTQKPATTKPTAPSNVNV